MINSIHRETTDPLNYDSRQLSDNHSGHLANEYFQKEELDSTPELINGNKTTLKLSINKLLRPTQKDKKLRVRERMPNEKIKRKRLVVKKGPENIPILLGKIVMIYTENKIVFAFNEDGNKYIVEENLTALTQTLNERIFFRANRQYIINVNYIKSFRAYERVKLKVDLTLDKINNEHKIIISQESAPSFRKWILSV